MKILFYNWVQYDDLERRGGGIRVYQENLIQHLADHSEHEITTVSGGLEYDVFNHHVRFERTKNSHPERVRSFALVNSPVLAPGHHAFGSLDLFDEGESLQAWHQFLRREGPFDVVQFDSLEGIPFTFLRVHEVLPEARTLLYAHNYYMLCPQVNLWKREEEPCSDYKDGTDCVTCVPHLADPEEVHRAQQLSRLLRKSSVLPGTRGYSLAYKMYGKLRQRRDSLPWRAITAALHRARNASRTTGTGNEPGSQSRHLAEVAASPVHRIQPVSLKSNSRAVRFKSRRTRALELLNSEVDVIVCTSHRVREILRAHGVHRSRLHISYVGTKVAEQFTNVDLHKEPRIPGQLSICYMGYMRKDKGFYFLLKTLEQCPPDVLSRLHLILAAKGTDPATMQRLVELSRKMVDVTHYDGYTHTQLPEILGQTDVGIVPVQWEDNLPQVATEMVAHGIPLVTSNRGGAKELGGWNPEFTFAASDSDELIELLRRLVEGEVHLAEYWESTHELTTMHANVQRLEELYRVPAQPSLRGDSNPRG